MSIRPDQIEPDAGGINAASADDAYLEPEGTSPLSWECGEPGTDESRTRGMRNMTSPWSWIRSASITAFDSCFRLSPAHPSEIRVVPLKIIIMVGPACTTVSLVLTKFGTQPKLTGYTYILMTSSSILHPNHYTRRQI